MKVSTIRELLVQAEETWGEEIVIRYKSGKGTVAEKSYTDLRKDSEHFSDLLETLKVRGGHVALIGPTSYEWILSYFGTVNSESVAVPLDASLPAADVCELVDRADAVVLVADEARKDVLEAARIQCPKLRYLISMQKTEDGDGILALPKLMEMTLERWNRELVRGRICSRISWLLFFLPPVLPERVRGLCLPIGILQKMPPVWI